MVFTYRQYVNNNTGSVEGLCSLGIRIDPRPSGSHALFEEPSRWLAEFHVLLRTDHLRCTCRDPALIDGNHVNESTKPTRIEKNNGTKWIKVNKTKDYIMELSNKRAS